MSFMSRRAAGGIARLAARQTAALPALASVPAAMRHTMASHCMKALASSASLMRAIPATSTRAPSSVAASIPRAFSKTPAVAPRPASALPQAAVRVRPVISSLKLTPGVRKAVLDIAARAFASFSIAAHARGQARRAAATSVPVRRSATSAKDATKDAPKDTTEGPVDPTKTPAAAAANAVAAGSTDLPPGFDVYTVSAPSPRVPKRAGSAAPSMPPPTDGNDKNDASPEALRERNLRWGYYMMALAVIALALSYLAVPLYAAFCQLTGIGGTTQRDQQVEDRNEYARRTAHIAADAPPLREITVRFEATVHPSLDWDFQPVQKEMKLRIGDTALAFYKAKNNMLEPWVGVATYNVLPSSAGLYFNKIQCFCFDEQRLRSGEELDMPLFYFLDPAMADDWRMDGVDLVTLSYTFFPVTIDEIPSEDPRVNRVLPGEQSADGAAELRSASERAAYAVGGAAGLPRTTPGLVKLAPGQTPEDLLKCDRPVRTASE